MTPERERYLTESEFCEHYKVSPRSAQRWRYTGEYGPAYVRLGGRRIAYRESDCEAWAAGNVYQHRAAELAKQGAELARHTSYRLAKQAA